MLSDYLDIYNLSGFKIEHYRRAQKQAQARVRYALSANVEGLKLLLVDDVSDGGDTFEVAVSHLHERGPPAEIRTAVLHHKAVSSFVPDFYTFGWYPGTDHIEARGVKTPHNQGRVSLSGAGV